MENSHRNNVQANQLLGAMEPSSRARLAPHLVPVTFKLGAVVCEAGGLLKHADFPQGSVLSLLTVLENGSAIETANIGREGAFGLFAAMYSRASFNRCLVQLEGGMVRCPISFCQLFRNATVASSTDSRVQCHAYNRAEDLPVVANDARPCARRGLALHA
jgi:hypothetical protein